MSIVRPSPNHSPRGGASIRAVVLHANAAGGGIGPALGWLTNAASKVSYHILVDVDGAVYRLVPDERAAWHAGPAVVGPLGKPASNLNRWSLGVAAHHPNDGSAYDSRQVAAMARVVAGWLRQYPIDLVTSHAAVQSNKNDPRGFPWLRFWAEVGA